MLKSVMAKWDGESRSVTSHHGMELWWMMMVAAARQRSPAMVLVQLVATKLPEEKLALRNVAGSVPID